MNWLNRIINWKPSKNLDSSRQGWFSPDLNRRYHKNFWKDLWRNEEGKVRIPTAPGEGNLSGSEAAGMHRPIVDLDWPHEYVPSSHAGHAHLYLNVEISRTRWVLLMLGLYFGRVISFAYLAWSLRRGQNFARQPHIVKESGGPWGDGPYEPSMNDDDAKF